MVPVPFRGVLTLHDLDHPQLLSPAFLPVEGDDVGLPHGMSCSWTQWHQQSPGRGCHRGRIVGAGTLGISNLRRLISELMEMLQRGKSRWMETTTGLCRRRSSFRVLEGGGGISSADFSPTPTRWPDSASANVKLSWDLVWLL